MRVHDVPRLTIGIEEEFQIVDAQGQLKSHIETLLAAAGGRFGDQLKREMMQSMIETVTPVCENVEEARKEMTRLRAGIAELAEQNSLAIVAAGAHPFSPCLAWVGTSSPTAGGRAKRRWPTGPQAGRPRASTVPKMRALTGSGPAAGAGRPSLPAPPTPRGRRPGRSRRLR